MNKKKGLPMGGFMIAAFIGLFYTFIFCTTGEIVDTTEFAMAEYTVEDTFSSEDTTAVSFNYVEETTKGTTATGAVVTTTAGRDTIAQPGMSIPKASGVGNNFGTGAVTSAKKTTAATRRTTAATTTTKAATTTPATTTTSVTTTTPVTTTVVTTTVPATTTTVPVTTTKATTTTVATTTTKATTTTPVTTTTKVTTTTPATTTAPVTTTATTTTKAKPATSSAGNLSYTYNGTKYTDTAYNVICKMVEAEMGPSFDEEAIKAQAVASYSYVKYFNERGSSPSIAIKSNVSTKVKNAVAEVIGQGIYYNGNICQAVYCASSGGATANAKDVWGGSVPYLLSVESEYDELYDKNYGRKVTFTESEVRTKIQNATGISLSDNPEEWLVIEDYVDGGYVGTVSIDGNTKYKKNGKTVNITGRVVRETIFSYGIRSAKFDVEYDDGTFTFTTYGYGHGVGMPQNGANYYALYEGYDYIDILEHYYTGVEIY